MQAFKKTSKNYKKNYTKKYIFTNENIIEAILQLNNVV